MHLRRRLSTYSIAARRVPLLVSNPDLLSPARTFVSRRLSVLAQQLIRNLDHGFLSPTTRLLPWLCPFKRYFYPGPLLGRSLLPCCCPCHVNARAQTVTTDACVLSLVPHPCPCHLHPNCADFVSKIKLKDMAYCQRQPTRQLERFVNEEMATTTRQMTPITNSGCPASTTNQTPRGPMDALNGPNTSLAVFVRPSPPIHHPYRGNRTKTGTSVRLPCPLYPSAPPPPLQKKRV